MYTKAGEKEFLKLYIGFSRCHQTSIWLALMVLLSSAPKRTMYNFKDSFFPIMSLLVEYNMFFIYICILPYPSQNSQCVLAMKASNKWL